MVYDVDYVQTGVFLVPELRLDEGIRSQFSPPPAVLPMMAAQYLDADIPLFSASFNIFSPRGGAT
jgi:hypothetical protein